MLTSMVLKSDMKLFGVFEMNLLEEQTIWDECKGVSALLYLNPQHTRSQTRCLVIFMLQQVQENNYRKEFSEKFQGTES